MPTPEFFTTHPLFAPVTVSEEDAVAIGTHGLATCPIEMYCPKCKRGRTWLADEPQGDGLVSLGESLYGAYWTHSYQCGACVYKSVFYILIRCRHEKGRYANWTATKIGQWPPISLDIEPALRKQLGEYEEIYKKGLICQAQGFGVGAFAYYRYIVESLIDGLLDRILAIVDDSTASPVREKLKKLKDDINVGKKIEKVKDILPAALKIEGMNPLETIYQLLSASIHQADEATCLEMGDTLRRCLVTLNQHISQMGDDSSFKTDVAKLLDKLAQRSKPPSK